MVLKLVASGGFAKTTSPKRPKPWSSREPSHSPLPGGMVAVRWPAAPGARSTLQIFRKPKKKLSVVWLVTQAPVGRSAATTATRATPSSWLKAGLVTGVFEPLQATALSLFGLVTALQTRNGAASPVRWSSKMRSVRKKLSLGPIGVQVVPVR